MPPTFSFDVDTLYTTTIATAKRKFTDNIFQKYPLLDLLRVHGRIDPDDNFMSGRHIEEPLEYGENTSFTSMGKGDTITVTPNDFLTKSQWDWKHFGGSALRYRVDDYKNRGDNQIIRMVDASIKNLEKSASKAISAYLYGDGTGNSGKDPDGLDNIIAENPTTGTVGNINAATYSFWRNQYKDMSGISFSADGLDWMENTINNCEDGGEMLDAIIMGQSLFETYSQSVRDMQLVTIIPTDSKPRKKMVDVGYRHRNLPFMEIPIFMDRTITKTDSIYFLDLNSLRFVGDRSHEWFELTPWTDLAAIQQPKDKVAYLLLTANLVCNERRRNGVMFDVS